MTPLYYAVIAVCGLLPLYLVRFTIPLGPISLPSTALEVLLLAVFAWWLWARGIRSREAWAALEPYAMPITLFVTGATVSMFVSPSLTASLGLWRAYIVEPLLFYVVATDVLSRAPRGMRAWPALAALGVTLWIVGVYAIEQKITGWGIPNPVWQAEETRRVTAFYGFPNGIALFAAPVTVLMAAWCAAAFDETVSLRGRMQEALNRTHRDWHGWFAFRAAILGTLAILFAVSEGGAIGTLAGLGLFGLMHPRLRAWTLGAVIAVCVAVITLPPLLRYVTSIATLADDSGTVRRVVWGESAAMLRDHAVFGAGLAGYPGRLAAYHTSDWVEIFQYPHTIVMNFWSETGLIGLAGFIWICVVFFRRGTSAMRDGGHGWLAAAVMAAMAATLVHGLVDVPFFKNDLAVLFWLLVALVEVARGERGAAEA